MSLKLLLASTLLALTASLTAQEAGGLNLPDPLISQSGERVTSAEQWQSKRRGEVLELFRENVYGRAPLGRPDTLAFKVTETTPDAMEGKATRKLVEISYGGPGGKGAMQLVLFVPNGRQKPAPCFLLICNRGKENIDPTREKKSPFWPAEEIVARGYAAAAFHNADIDPDKDDGFKNGVHAIFDPATGRQPDSWATIAAWAWGASRALDYLETDPSINAKRVAVVGHSRGGKTALWAGAEDQRFAMAVSNDSGCTGASIARQKGGEQIAVINKSFPHWFCANYKKFNGRENDLPVDQHELDALIAPRLLYVASAEADAWSDPKHEFLGAFYASPVYRLFGMKGLAATEMPPLDSPSQEGEIGYHIRTGKHDLTVYDWNCFMDFADKHMLAH